MPRHHRSQDRLTFDGLPLYPDEAEIARAVFGPKRAKAWAGLAVVLSEAVCRASVRCSAAATGRPWRRFWTGDITLEIQAWIARAVLLPGARAACDGSIQEAEPMPQRRRPEGRLTFDRFTAPSSTGPAASPASYRADVPSGSPPCQFGTVAQRH